MAKTANYTPEMTAELVDGYVEIAAESEEVRNAYVAEMAAKFSKSVRSIRAKLSRENVYVAKTPVSKVTGDKPAKKEDLAVELATVTGLPLVSAEKLNKTDLVALIAFARGVNEAEEV